MTATQSESRRNTGDYHCLPLLLALAVYSARDCALALDGKEQFAHLLAWRPVSWNAEKTENESGGVAGKMAEKGEVFQ